MLYILRKISSKSISTDKLHPLEKRLHVIHMYIFTFYMLDNQPVDCKTTTTYHIIYDSFCSSLTAANDLKYMVIGNNLDKMIN